MVVVYFNLIKRKDRKWETNESMLCSPPSIHLLPQQVLLLLPLLLTDTNSLKFYQHIKRSLDYSMSDRRTALVSFPG